MTGTRPAPFGVGTLLICLLFGTNFFLFSMFQVIKFFSKPSDAVTKKSGKEMSKPFTGTVDCFTNLTAELFRLSLIMAMTYICEYNWFFEHSAKSYSRDLFLFVLILFFAYAYYTIKPITDLTLLGREQTEEWKGWMQFIFLLYHYFHAEEVYNSVRVMITCYVWMTGFGNFSFFYVKQDFSWLRIVQMLWRLNFSVLLLMWTHENTYILYYICPMHTFYFLMVFVTMYLFSSWNQSKWAIRWKLLALAVVIYVVWDVNGGLFDFLFSWLGTDKIIGANSGSVWEYYFRTSLDHWSTLFGMIFAVNFPLAEQFFVKARGTPLILAAVLMGALTIWWVVSCYSLEKLQYNLSHSYFAIIPLTSYIFFRNITPAVRGAVSMSLHDLGKTTLETYLLQHHIWLTSNAKTLWTLIPNHPWINFAVVTFIFFAVSKELYRLTMSLRGMILPDDKDVAWANLLGVLGIVLGLGLMANVLIAFQPSLGEIVIACEGLCIACVLLIGRYAHHDLSSVQHHMNKFMKWMVILLGATLLVQLIYGSSHASTVIAQSSNGSNVASLKPYLGNSQSCLSAVSHGHWTVESCDMLPLQTSTSAKHIAYCAKNVWSWDGVSADCPIARLSSTKTQSVFKNKKVLFLGDSLVRSTYHQFNSLLQPNYDANYTMMQRQSEMQFHSPGGVSTSFQWAPFVQNVTDIVRSLDANNRPDILVTGAVLWDALHVHSAEQYKQSLSALDGALREVLPSNSTFKVWVLPTVITDGRLSSDEKRQFMNERVVDEYRKIAAKVSSADVVLDTLSASALRQSTTTDGVHYADEVYAVIGQMIANVVSLQSASNYLPKAPKPYVPKVTGAMSNPHWGAGVLVLIAVMLFTMDSFLGIGWISLTLFGRSLDWETAYEPLHAKLNRTSAPSPPKTDVHEEERTGLIKKETHGDNSA